MKKTFLLFFIFPSLVFSQKKWYSLTGNDVAIITTQVGAGVADAFNQLIAFKHYGRGVKFLDFDSSWQNKYRDWNAGDHRAAFPGSKTWLVGFTDGYHLSRTVDRAMTLVSIGIAYGELRSYPKKDRWKVIAKKLLLSAISNRLSFNIFYNKIPYKKG